MPVTWELPCPPGEVTAQPRPSQGGKNACQVLTQKHRASGALLCLFHCQRPHTNFLPKAAFPIVFSLLCAFFRRQRKLEKGCPAQPQEARDHWEAQQGLSAAKA